MRHWWKFFIPLCDRQDNWLSVTILPLEKQVLFRAMVFIKCYVTSAEESAQLQEQSGLCGRQCDWMDFSGFKIWGFCFLCFILIKLVAIM